MNISKINLKGTDYDIKDKLVRDSIGIPASENNSLGIAPLDASGKVPSENLPTVDRAVNITYSELKALRDGGTLIPGQFYRITDYVTTTTQEDTQSAGHQFDIIVRADDVNVLNENAYAALHAGDTYFANSKLEAWELKYCIDNDIERFVWAMAKSEGAIVTPYGTFPHVGEETIDGITYQKWKCTPPIYDIFEYAYTKNGSSDVYGLYNGTIAYIEFSYTKITPPTEEEGYGVIYWMKDEFNNECPYDFKNILFSIAGGYYYTFNVVADSYVMTDYSLNGAKCFDNKIMENKSGNAQKLNRIVFKNTKNASNYSNTLGSNCYSNTFGDSCNYNTLGSSCNSNTFGDYCYYNTFGDYCSHNTFGDSCNYNTFSNNCNSNTLGSNCNSNTLGSSCNSNTFSNYCGPNTFGDYCNSNTLGGNCYSNTFGDDCSHNTFGKAVTKYVIIENGNKYITLTSTETTSSSSSLQNIKISQGVNNTTTNKTISHNTVNDTFQTIYQPANSQTILI